MGAHARYVIAIVPVRSLSGAKSRLGEPLDAEERAELILALLRRTVEQALAAECVARAMGAASLLQVTDGLNAALDEALAAVAKSAAAVIVIPADLPGVTGAAIDLLATAARDAAAAAGSRDGPAVGLVPDQHGMGTNTLFVTPPGAIPFRFGEHSRAAHAAAARAAGAAYVELDGPLGFDLDTPDDLLEADKRGLGHEAGR